VVLEPEWLNKLQNTEMDAPQTPPQAITFEDFDDIFGLDIGPIVKISDREVDEQFQRQSAMLCQRIAAL